MTTTCISSSIKYFILLYHKFSDMDRKQTFHIKIHAPKNLFRLAYFKSVLVVCQLFKPPCNAKDVVGDLRTLTKS